MSNSLSCHIFSLLSLSLAPVNVDQERVFESCDIAHPGHPLFQGVSYVLLTCPIILIPVLSWGGPSISSWPISNQRLYSAVG